MKKSFLCLAIAFLLMLGGAISVSATSDKTSLYTQNFDGETISVGSFTSETDAATKLGVTFEEYGTNGNTVEVVEENGNKVLKLIGDGKSMSAKRMYMYPALKTTDYVPDGDRLYIEFDFKMTELPVITDMFGIIEESDTLKWYFDQNSAKTTSRLRVKPGSAGSVFPGFNITAESNLNEWFTAKLIVDFDDNGSKTVKSYLYKQDGTEVFTPVTTTLAKVEGNSEKVSEIYFSPYIADKDSVTVYYLDNVDIYTVKKFAVVSSVPANGAEKVVPESDIKVTLNNNVNTDTKDNITITANGEPVQKTEYSVAAEGKTITITFNDLMEYGADYLVDFAGVKDLAGQELTETLEFAVEAAPEVQITETTIYNKSFGEFVPAENMIADNSVSALVVSVENKTNTEKNAVVIAAAYDATDRLVDCVFISEPLAANAVQSVAGGMKVASSYAGGRVKLFLWESIDTLKPYQSNISLDIAAAQ